MVGTTEIECRDRFDEYYKYDKDVTYTPSGTTTAKTFTFKQCLLTKEDCLSFANINKNPGDEDAPIFYNEKLKKCWNSYQTEYYYSKLKTLITDKKYELVEICDKYFYTDNSENICVASCKDITGSLNLYFISNNKKCLDLGDCYTYHKYYYDPQNNECLDTCKGRALNKFQEEFPTTQSTSMECKPQCSGSKKYHNYDSNVCLSKCGADGSNKKYHKYDENICYPSCSDIPNGPYEYEIKDSSNDVYICYDDSSLSDDDTVNCD
ncbi:MAG: hypothetical protein J6O41_02870, partial [Clostridia bacterium]|nr:hypothetical protein [Clostridia bacterium]